jgi:hypothetical protein
MGDALRKSKGTLRRNLADWCVGYFPKIGKFHLGLFLQSLLFTKEEQEEQQQLLDEFGKGLKKSREFFDACMEKCPELKPWFSEEKMSRGGELTKMGGQLVAWDAVQTFNHFIGIEEMAPFLKEFAINDEVYGAIIRYFVQLPTVLEHKGFTDEFGKIIDIKDVVAVEQTIYNSLAETLVKAAPKQWTYEVVREKLPSYL